MALDINRDALNRALLAGTAQQRGAMPVGQPVKLPGTTTTVPVSGGVPKVKQAPPNQQPYTGPQVYAQPVYPPNRYTVGDWMAGKPHPSGLPLGTPPSQQQRTFTGWGPAANQMTGFDLNRYASQIIPAGPSHPEYGAKKITFAQLASNSPLQPPPNLASQAARENWVRQSVQNLVNQLQAQGERVRYDGLDRIFFEDAPQDGWIDVMQNKDWLKTGQGPLMWSWQHNHGAPEGAALQQALLGGGMIGDIMSGLSGSLFNTAVPRENIFERLAALGLV